MKYVRTAEIPLAEIIVEDRLRAVDADAVEALAESMAEIGQQTAIEVVQYAAGQRDFGRHRLDTAAPYKLVAGAHRTAAALKLGWKKIRAEVKQAAPKVDADLQVALREIDENLYRYGLNPLDRAVFIARRYEIWRELHPESQHGGDRKSPDFKAKNQEPDTGFWSETAERIMLGETTLKRAWRIYKKIPAETRARIAATPIARYEAWLYELTRHSPAHQQKILDTMLRETEQGYEVACIMSDAVAALDQKAKRPKPAYQLETERLREAWDRAGKRAQVAHLEFLKEIGVIKGYTVEHL